MPVQEPTLLVLTVLASGPRHGYGLMRDIETISQGQVTLRASTLYAVLDRLTTDGLVEVEREEAVSGRLRRYHRLTPRGADVLQAEVERLERISRVARERLVALRPALTVQVLWVTADERLEVRTATAVATTMAPGHTAETFETTRLLTYRSVLDPEVGTTSRPV